MKLKARSLDAVGAPGLYLVAGSVDHARFVLPWARLGAKPVKAEIRGVALRVRETRDDDVIATAVEGWRPSAAASWISWRPCARTGRRWPSRRRTIKQRH